MKVTSLACIQGAWLPDIQPCKILDIGAGTGLLTLMAAQKFNGDFDSVEIERNAFQQLVENVSGSGWHDRINCHHKDIRNFANENSTTYDFIITNPPFYQKQLSSPDSTINQARHSTDLDLKDLLSIVSKLLNPKGIASILLPVLETNLLIGQSMKQSLHATNQLIIHDQPHKAPIAIVTYFSKKSGNIIKKRISIKNSDNNWSGQYIALLRPYYLNI